MTWYDLMVNDMTVDNTNGTVTINWADSNDISSHAWNNYSSYDIQNAIKNSSIQIEDEQLDADMIKRMRLLFAALENHPAFADIIKDIDTQIAFEKLGKDK